MNALFPETGKAGTTIRQMRRRQLTGAAFEVLKTEGLKGTTIAKVARRAGLSKGVLLHYFADKDALLEAVMRESNAMTQRCVTALLKRSNGPWERLYACIYGNFSPVIFTREVAHAWVCLCAEVPPNPQYQRIQTVTHARMRSNLQSALRGIVRADQVDRLTNALITASDGLWLQAALNGREIPANMALTQVEELLDAFLRNSATEIDGQAREAARRHMDSVSGILFSA